MRRFGENQEQQDAPINKGNSHLPPSPSLSAPSSPPSTRSALSARKGPQKGPQSGEAANRGAQASSKDIAGKRSARAGGRKKFNDKDVEEIYGEWSVRFERVSEKAEGARRLPEIIGGAVDSGGKWLASRPLVVLGAAALVLIVGFILNFYISLIVSVIALTMTMLLERRNPELELFLWYGVWFVAGVAPFVVNMF